MPAASHPMHPVTLPQATQANAAFLAYPALQVSHLPAPLISQLELGSQFGPQA